MGEAQTLKNENKRETPHETGVVEHTGAQRRYRRDHPERLEPLLLAQRRRERERERERCVSRADASG
jgi:hypothetical protein